MGRGLLENNLSLRTSAHTGVAIPRLGVKTRIFYINSLKIRGIPTPVCALARNDAAFLTALLL